MKELKIIQMEEMQGGISQADYMCGVAGAIFAWGIIATAIFPPAGAIAISVGMHGAVACFL